jgi:hypothetical protein
MKFLLIVEAGAEKRKNMSYLPGIFIMYVYRHSQRETETFLLLHRRLAPMSPRLVSQISFSVESSFCAINKLKISIFNYFPFQFARLVVEQINFSAGKD